MDTGTLIIGILAVVVVGVLAFFFGKKPAALPGESETKALPSKAPPPPRKGSSRPPAAADETTRMAPGTHAPDGDDGESTRMFAPDEALLDASRAEAALKPAPGKKEVAAVRKGLSATRTGFIDRLTALFGGKKEFDPAILEQLEEVMLTSDVGVKTTQTILDRLRDRLKKNELRDSDAVWAALRAEASRILTLDGGAIALRGKPTVVLMVGVNGVGKTTTIGKLATHFTHDGKKVVLAAGDTFRAAAVQQLEVWGKRVGVDVVRGKEGADPGAVAFEAVTKVKDSDVDLLLVDTAGRLHTKANLMDEIKKVRKTVAKAMDGAPHETLLVLDATTGQNAVNQASLFKEALDLTGIILTKLDGTAKGGIVLGICDELKLPVRYIGLGERAEDLRPFRADEFVEALFGRDGDESRAA
ncbi:MAG: signal recognition particle-docking protein FtsY [Polyangiaceae bacterium]